MRSVARSSHPQHQQHPESACHDAALAKSEARGLTCAGSPGSPSLPEGRTNAIIHPSDEETMAIHKLVDVNILAGYRLQLKFADGVRGTVDLARLAGKGVFELWNDRSEFEKATIGPAGQLSWGEDVDLCPDSLYLLATGKQPEEVFPLLREEAVHA